MRTTFFSLIFLFSILSFSQDVLIGKFCSNLSEQKTISTIQQRCFTFKEDGTFIEEIKLDISIVLTGKYLFSNNLIALTYDDEKNETSILKIIKISDKKIVFKYLSKDRSSKRIKSCILISLLPTQKLIHHFHRRIEIFPNHFFWFWWRIKISFFIEVFHKWIEFWIEIGFFPFVENGF